MPITLTKRPSAMHRSQQATRSTISKWIGCVRLEYTRARAPRPTLPVQADDPSERTDVSFHMVLLQLWRGFHIECVQAAARWCQFTGSIPLRWIVLFVPVNNTRRGISAERIRNGGIQRTHAPICLAQSLRSAEPLHFPESIFRNFFLHSCAIFNWYLLFSSLSISLCPSAYAADRCGFAPKFYDQVFENQSDEAARTSLQAIERFTKLFTNFAKYG